MLNVLLLESPDALAAILRFFRPQPGLLVDITYGIGSLVKALPNGWRLVGLDLAGAPAEAKADWAHLPIRSDTADVALYDPPYLVGRTSKRLYGKPDIAWARRHTTLETRVDHTAPVREAARILRPGGLFVAKIQNSRHKGVLVEQDRAVREAIVEAGMILREIIVYIRLLVGLFSNPRTPQQAYGFYIIAEKPE